MGGGHGMGKIHPQTTETRTGYARRRQNRRRPPCGTQPLCRGSPPDKAEGDQEDCNHQEDVNIAAECIRGDQAEQPCDKEDNSD
jgi:hypothetical protein